MCKCQKHLYEGTKWVTNSGQDFLKDLRSILKTFVPTTYTLFSLRKMSELGKGRPPPLQWTWALGQPTGRWDSPWGSEPIWPMSQHIPVSGPSKKTPFLRNRNLSKHWWERGTKQSGRQHRSPPHQSTAAGRKAAVENRKCASCLCPPSVSTSTPTVYWAPRDERLGVQLKGGTLACSSPRLQCQHCKVKRPCDIA